MGPPREKAERRRTSAFAQKHVVLNPKLNILSYQQSDALPIYLL
jgi:hypothetical protein